MVQVAMATTSETKPTLPYPEHEKLGPLGARTSAIQDPAALRTALIRAFEAAAHDARDAVAAIDKGAAPAAVHASRKALRRARAVLGLVAGALPKGERSAVRAALQDARRALSTVRDHSVAPEALALMALDDDDRAVANRVLANAAEAMPAVAEIKQLLAESAARAAAQAEALQAALPHDVEFDVVAAGVRATYSQARKAARAAKRSKSWFHTWRRRSKELVYQLELVAHHAGPRVIALRDEVTGSTEVLGPAVDLIMVRDFVATYGQGVAPEALHRLRDTIDTHLDELMKTACKASRETFRQRAKKLEKRLTKSVRRDLAPPDDGNGAPEAQA
jgi:CHAD domain-containing protein